MRFAYLVLIVLPFLEGALLGRSYKTSRVLRYYRLIRTTHRSVRSRIGTYAVRGRSSVTRGKLAQGWIPTHQAPRRVSCQGDARRSVASVQSFPRIQRYPHGCRSAIGVNDALVVLGAPLPQSCEGNCLDPSRYSVTTTKNSRATNGRIWEVNERPAEARVTIWVRVAL